MTDMPLKPEQLRLTIDPATLGFADPYLNDEE